MLNNTTVLLCGNNAIAGTARETVLQTKQCRFEQLDDVAVGIHRVRQGGVGLVLLAIAGSDDAAIVTRFMRFIEQHPTVLPTLVLAEQSDSDLTLQMLKMGVVDCLSQPLNTSRLGMLVDMFTVRARYAEPAAAKNDGPEFDISGAFDGCVIASKAMQQLVRQIRMAAPLDSTILLSGETGTGKTYFARAIHRFARGNHQPFLVVNCGALSPSLIESEMFGHARGAFTGADREHTGKLEASREGTLLLDEIDSLPMSLQAKLLRVVEERVFEPVGSNRTLPLLSRLIVATNRSLADEVAAGRFRSDLYFRLNVLDLHVPPLRERREAIPALIDKMLGEFAVKFRRSVHGFSSAARTAMLAYDWPGNVRELRNVVERAVAFSGASFIELDDLPVVIQFALPAVELRAGQCNRLAEARQVAETRQLSDALERHNNNRSRAAAALGISRVTLYKKLRQHGLV